MRLKLLTNREQAVPNAGKKRAEREARDRGRDDRGHGPAGAGSRYDKLHRPEFLFFGV